jgi:hypothetical protein
MAIIQHVDITDPQVHEPKGASTATVDAVYLSDGAGSGAWEYPDYTLEVDVENISVAGSAWVVAPYAGNIIKMYSVIDGSITVANNTVTLEIAGVAVTNGTLTIAFSGSAAGIIDECTPTALNAVTAGQAIEIVYGGSTTSRKARFTLVIKRTS